jgi:hypothetical protein
VDELLRLLSARPGQGAPASFSRARVLAAPALMAATTLVAASNVAHYVSWQRRPHTRFERHLYVTSREFDDWAARVERNVRDGGRIMNVGQWRDEHPIHDLSNPYAR